MALLKRSDRRRLDAAVLRLTEEDKERLQSEKQLDGIPSLIGFDRGRSGVVQVVCEEYLRAKLADQLDRQHVLYRSFREAGVFQRAARRVVVPMGLNERDRASFQRQFLRYLHISDNHPDAVVGRVLYELLMIVYPTGSRSQTSEFASAWWQQVPPGHPFAPVPDEVRWVGDLIMDALGANRRLTELIWLAHLHWRMGRMWQKLTGRFLPVFRAAKFLKDREGWIYRRYRDQVDYFHARTVKLLLKLERRGLLRIRERECALRSFRHSLRKEPLLNCVFHADVLQGKRLVMPPQGRADNLVYPRLMALVVHVLRKAHPRTPAVTVQDVFRNEKGLPENALRAITPSARDKDQRVGGYSHFAYAAPLVATILGVSLINADTVKDNFKRYRDDCEVRRQRELLGL